MVSGEPAVQRCVGCYEHRNIVRPGVYDAVQVSLAIWWLFDQTRQPPEPKRAQYVAAVNVVGLVGADRWDLSRFAAGPEAAYRRARLIACGVAAYRQVVDHSPEHRVLAGAVIYHLHDRGPAP